MRKHDLGFGQQVLLLRSKHLRVRQLFVLKPNPPSEFASAADQLLAVGGGGAADEEEVDSTLTNCPVVAKAVRRQSVVVVVIPWEKSMAARIYVGSQLVVCFSVAHIADLNRVGSIRDDVEVRAGTSPAQSITVNLSVDIADDAQRGHIPPCDWGNELPTVRDDLEPFIITSGWRHADRR